LVPEQRSGEADELLFPNGEVVPLGGHDHVEAGTRGLVAADGGDNFFFEVSLLKSRPGAKVMKLFTSVF
jgi:hypothetical protein